MMKSTKKCPSFSTISSAADGNEMAIEKILTMTLTYSYFCYFIFRSKPFEKI